MAVVKFYRWLSPGFEAEDVNFKTKAKLFVFRSRVLKLEHELFEDRISIHMPEPKFQPETNNVQLDDTEMKIEL